MRTLENFNTDWIFKKENTTSKESPNDWEKVVIPHTWNNIDGQDGGNDYYRGTCTYEKTFTKPNVLPNGKVILEFLGVAMTANVFVNGKHLCVHKGGYSTFRVDITDVLEEENILVVTVDNGDNDTVYPQKADFTFYGGIYRSVNLITVAEAHFELLVDGAPGLKATPLVNGENGTLEIETFNNGKEVNYTVFNQEGEIVATQVIETVEGRNKATFEISNPILWDGVINPYLYTVKAELLNDGSVVDVVSTEVGFRTFDFDAEKGFILNGKSYPLRGVSRHQDFEGVGNAITYEMQVNDMEIIKEIGANTIRLAHYQHAQEFYDLCDREGMIVWAEIPYITKHMENGRENTITQMRELVAQSYNHPSIICWGLSNEVTATGQVTDDMIENHKILNDLCHEMDKTRPTTMAHVFMLEIDSPIVELPDISSYNLYFGWYLGQLEQNDKFFDDYHAKYPERIIGFSEYGADANPQFQTNNPSVGDYTETYQAVYHEHLLECIDARPYLWATHVWNMFDFAADGRDEGGAHGLNQKGLVSFNREYRKDAFYIYKAYWNNTDPFVHLCAKKYVDRVEDVTNVKVYTNQPEVSLYVDGKLVETKQVDKKVTFELAITGEHTIEVKSGTLNDSGVIKKVNERNESYLFAKEEIINWFDKDELNSDYLSINDTLGDISAHPQGAMILDKIMSQAKKSRGDVAEEASSNDNMKQMMATMPLKQILKMVGDAIPKEQVKALNASLQKLKK